MLAAVKLDDQVLFRTAEVGDETTHGMLTTKLCSSKLPRAYPHPEPEFCFGLAAAQTTSTMTKY